MKEYALIVLLASVVVAAGCVGSQPTNVDSNNGLSFLDFSATPASVISGEPVIFEGEIANVGGTTAKNVQIDLFYVNGIWRTTMGNIVDSTLTQGPFSALNPPEPALNRPGESKLFQLQLMSPDLQQGIAHTYTVEARATYDYNTSGFIDVPALSLDELARRQALGQKQTDFPPAVLNSAGPIHMSMDTKFTPIIVDTKGDSVQKFPLRIIFSNVGSGFPITNQDEFTIRGGGGKLTGTLELRGPGAEFEDCMGATGGTTVSLDSADIPLMIKTQNNQATLPCTVRINLDRWNDAPEGNVELVFSLFYRYYTRQNLQVSVAGHS